MIMNHSFPNRTASIASDNRRGAVLIVVMVLVFLLPLGAYTFSQLMISEMEATVHFQNAVRTRVAAESAVEFIAATLTDRPELTEIDLLNNPALFQNVTTDFLNVEESNAPRFTIVAPMFQENEPVGVRFGLTNESSKINLNALIEMEKEFGLEEEETREFLMYLPGMTESIADSILDWIDPDDDRREFGAESESYVDVIPLNGPLESLDDLLQIYDITPDLLFGEDANRNGLLDENENDGEATQPFDNADGVLQTGWVNYLTVYSVESNLRFDGEEKINLNDDVLTDLYDALEEEFGEEIAQFVVAYRLYGPSNADGNPATGGTSGDVDTDELLNRAAKGFAESLFGGGKITRGGMDLSSGPAFDILSIYDLVDAEVTGEIDGVDKTLTPIFTSDPSSLNENIPTMVETFSTSSGASVPGRINVLYARDSALFGVPGITVETVDAILAKAESLANGTNSTSSPIDTTTGWILADGIVDVETMRILDRYLTSGGDVYRAQILGHTARKGSFCRLEVVVDASQQPPFLIFQRDLTKLGKGYDYSEWLPEQTENLP